MTKQYRPSDVLLHADEAIPAHAALVPGQGNRVIVAKGELTGHAHALSATEATMFRDECSGRLFPAIGRQGAELRNEEHARSRCRPGITKCCGSANTRRSGFVRLRIDPDADRT